MPWTRPNRWILCLLLLTAFCLGMAVHVVVAHDFVSAPSLSEPEQRIVAACLTLAAVVGGFARMEMVTRRKAHDLAGGQHYVSLQVEEASQAAKSCAEIVNQRLNGELDQRIIATVDRALDAALDKRMDALASKIAERISKTSRNV